MSSPCIISGLTSRKVCWGNSWTVLTPSDLHFVIRFQHQVQVTTFQCVFQWTAVPQMSWQNRPGPTFKLYLAAVDCVHLNIFYRITEHSELGGTHKDHLLSEWPGNWAHNLGTISTMLWPTDQIFITIRGHFSVCICNGQMGTAIQLMWCFIHLESWKL